MINSGEYLPQIYVPLSQTMTDSSESEEGYNLNKNGIVKKHNNLQKEEFQNNKFHQITGNQSYYLSPTVGNSFRNVIMSSIVGSNQGNNLSSFNSDGFQTDADNVAILSSNDGNISDSMSYPRKCCFFISIFVCVLTIAAFLIMPCGESGTCPALVDRVLAHNWLNNYTKIELKGIINVVNGVRSWEKNLIFLYRGDSFFSEFERRNIKRNGIISLIGISGSVAWFDETIEEPITIDCNLLDIDNNGTPDCLVISEYGELGAINPTSGQWYWKFKERSKHKIDALDFPIILPDLDGDNVLDILLATSPTQEGFVNLIRHENEHRNIEYLTLPGERNFLRILSGRTGKSMGDGYKIYDCDFLRKFQLERHLITYNCVKNKTEVQRSKSLFELYSLITNKSIGQKLATSDYIAQHRHYGQRKETEAQRNIYSLNGRELIIENRGKCPDDCNVSFIISESRHGKVHVLRNFSHSTMYGMVPVQWHFKHGKSNLAGFVMKFWMWNRDNKNNNVNSQYDDAFTISTNSIHSERSLANTTKHKKHSYKIQIITETVFLIIFNGTDTRIENTSQSNVVQFCRNEHKEIICQPDLNNQENSLLIADLDQDGSQELVSYYSTFVRNGDGEGENWKLVTFVQLLRLESELPSFYRSIKHN